MNSDLIQKAKNIISKIPYITIASVSKEGIPWNTPVYAVHNENYNFFWNSPKNSQHSQNIRETTKVFIVIYDSVATEGTGDGVYAQGYAKELAGEKEIEDAVNFLYSQKNKIPPPPSQFLNESPKRFYKFTPEKFWLNTYENKIDGRVEIQLP